MSSGTTACPDCGVANAADHNYCKHCGVPLKVTAVEHEMAGSPAERMRDRYRALCDAYPDNAAAHFNLGRALARQGKGAEAAPHFDRAIQLRPKEPEFTAGFAWFLATDADPRARDGARAVALATQACKQTRDQDARMLGTLAAAYAEVGRFAEAVETSRKAIRVAHASEQEALIPSMEERLNLYERHQPVRESAARDDEPPKPSG